MSPGGHHQWQPNANVPIMMLTTDVSLLNDPTGSFQQYVKLFASNITALEDAFSKTWYKLTTRDMGPVTRCAGPWVPAAQPFQYPLPPTPSNLPDFDQVALLIANMLYTNQSSILPPDSSDGNPYYGAIFVHLAFQCASTFRASDFLGGCNGARIRFAPQISWPANSGMDKALQLLQPIKDAFGDNLSWADLIVLAATTALADASEADFTFCGGRTDAKDGSGWQILSPNGDLSSPEAFATLQSQTGLTTSEIVALMGRPRSPSQMYRMGYYGSWTMETGSLSNEYFVTLLNNMWQPYTVPGSGAKEYQAVGTSLFATPADLGITWDTNTLAIAQDFASDSDLFMSEFVSAWTKLMNIDRFDGPTGNVCDRK
jgi:catalase (peroxidase I)